MVIVLQFISMFLMLLTLQGSYNIIFSGIGKEYLKVMENIGKIGGK